MSWVWPELVNIYLSQRLALVQTGCAAPMAVSYSPTLPFATALEKVAAAAFEGKSRRRLRLTLSAAFAPPISYRVPREVRRWSEKGEIARAAAAQSLSTQAELVECRMDSRSHGIAAALAAPALRQLHAWAVQSGGRIVSIQPLWSIATQCKAANSTAIDGVIVQEPDGVCLLIGSGRREVLPLVRVLAGRDSAIEAETAALLRDADVREERVLNLSFGAAMKDVVPGLPKHWARHWERQ